MGLTWNLKWLGAPQLEQGGRAALIILGDQGPKDHDLLMSHDPELLGQRGVAVSKDMGHSFSALQTLLVRRPLP